MLKKTMTATRSPRVAVLLSGAGNTFAALVSAVERRLLPAKIVLVVSDKVAAGGLLIAEQARIPTAQIARTEFANKFDFESALLQAIEAVEPDWIVLAGFMRVLSPRVCDAWVGRAINLHPSLLPKYPGLDTHQRAIDAGDLEAGASVHYVTAELDAGAVIAQIRVAILPGDTAACLAQRVKPAEQTLLVDCLNQLIHQRQSSARN